MAAQTQVVVTTVGPYNRYGLPLVAACAAAGTDYADLTGEPMFMRESIDLYHKQADRYRRAHRARVRIRLHPFGSHVSYALYRQAAEDAEGELIDTAFVVRKMVGGLSGGTVASITDVVRAASSDPETRRPLEDPYTLTTDRAAEPELGAQPDYPWRRGDQIAPELDGYLDHRLHDGIHEYPSCQAQQRITGLGVRASGFRYSECQSMGSIGRSLLSPSAVAAGVSTAFTSLGARYFDKVPEHSSSGSSPKPGTGPSERTRERGRYIVETYTTTTTGARYRATMSQKGDPGYKATSVLLGESGLALALDRDRLSDLRGVLTPAAAMGDALLARFPAAGVSLETVRLN